jgi:type I restriction enzyme R subunit
MLVRKYQDSRGEDREVCAQIERAVDSSPSLRSKKDLIEAFVESLSVDADMAREWRAFIEQKRREELDRIIADENLDPEATRAYIDGAFRDGAIQPTGTAITHVLPPMSRFSPTGAHAAKKQTVIEKLGDYFERFFGLS